MEQQTRQTRAAARRKAVEKNRCRHGLTLGALLLAAVLLLDLVTLFTADRRYSENENRMLAQKPAFSLASLADGSFFSGVEDWLADQFAGRDFWMSADLARSRFFGAKENGGVYLCADGWLIQSPGEPNGPALERNLAAMNDFAAAYPELNVQMTAVPNAACILQDKLPANAPVRDQRADLAAIAARLSGVELIDVTDALAAHSGEYIYYRTDHHWTSLGAYYAFEAMAERLGLTPVADYDVYTVGVGFEGTLASKSGCHEATDTVQIYVPKTDVEYCVTYQDTQKKVSSLYDRACLDTKDQYTVFFGGNHPRIDVETTAGTGRSLLLFKDSYANCFVQFLTPYYDRIILVDPRYYYDSLETLLKQEQITDVLFLYNLDTFQSDTSLADVLESGMSGNS